MSKIVTKSFGELEPVHSRKRLIPKPHIIKAMRARNWNLEGAIEELVDNSIGHGRATEVIIDIDSANYIKVIDNGIGVKNINSIFHYGDATAHGDLAEIGQYGVGAKHAAIWLGDVTNVQTVRDGRLHEMRVDWRQVDRSGEWPLEYQGVGRPAKLDERGTTITMSKLARYYFRQTTEKTARSLGQIFAPALRRGVQITIRHGITNDYDIYRCEPFTPQDLTDEIKIGGEIKTASGILKWSGRAGLSASLVERFNAVHIAFQHRVIEATRDPFRGKSAPTLYAEVQLDGKTPWKHQLSEHKDKVVRYREELMDAIHDAIKALIEKSEQQAQALALNGMVAPIESALNKALKAAGLLHIDPDEEPELGPGPDHPDPPDDPKPRDHVIMPKPEGDPAKEVKKPTGVRFEFRKDATLEGKAYSWEISGPTMTVLLGEDLFKPVINWPPKARDKHTAHMIVGILSHAIEIEYWANENVLRGVITSKLKNRIEGWVATNGKEVRIAPYLYRDLIECARLPE
jgi:hypothetical protein